MFDLLAPKYTGFQDLRWNIPMSSLVILAAIVFSERELTFTFAICYRHSVYLSVCRLSVTLVHPTQPVEIFRNFFSPYDSTGTLVFWCQNSLVGDAPFP